MKKCDENTSSEEKDDLPERTRKLFVIRNKHTWHFFATLSSTRDDLLGTQSIVLCSPTGRIHYRTGLVRAGH